METAVQIREEASLIKSTDLDRLLLEYKKMQNTNPNSSINSDRINVITRQIKTSYCFLVKLGKPGGEMNADEYSLAQAEIRKKAELDLAICEEEYDKTVFFRWFKKIRLGQKIRRIKFILNNRYFLEFFDNTFYGQWNHYRAGVPDNLPELVQDLYRGQFGYTINVQHVCRHR